MNSIQNFARQFCLPAASIYGLLLVGYGGLGFFLSSFQPRELVLPLSGISVLHYVFTSRKHLGTRSFKPSAALDEWNLLQSDLQQVVTVRLLTRITGGIAAVWCMLILAMTLMGFLGMAGFFSFDLIPGLGSTGLILLTIVHIMFCGFTLVYVLSAWRIHYLDDKFVS